MVNRGHTEILTSRDTDPWSQVLEEIGTYCFYHLPGFHRLEEMHGQGQAVMPVFREGNHVLAFPMLLRDIEMPSTARAAGRFRDATSVRGFTGPLATQMPEDVRQRFLERLQDFFEQNRIVAVYSRLHPLTTEASLLEGYGQAVEIGVTLSVDLTAPLDVQVARYERDLMRRIRQAGRKGFECEQAGIECLDDFLRVYYDTMDRVNADKAYYFDRSHFEYLMHEMSDVVRLFVCRIDGIVASACINGACGGIVEAYLAGTGTEYVRSSTSTLLYDTIRGFGSEIGAKAYHLGGGVGAQRDSLYRFKMSFGTQEHVYYTWRHVANRDVYDEICQTVCGSGSAESDGSYFPRYRDPSLRLKGECDVEPKPSRDTVHQR